MKHQTTRSTIFVLHGVPAFTQAFPLALQHVVAMIVGCVTPAIIVSGVAGLSEADSVVLIQAALVTSALSTLLQLFPFIKTRYFAIGSGLPVIMGISFAYVPSMQSIAAEYDVAAILGAMIVGGAVAVFVGLFIRSIRRFFPPLITGTVVFTILSTFWAFHYLYLSFVSLVVTRFTYDKDIIAFCLTKNNVFCQIIVIGERVCY